MENNKMKFLVAGLVLMSITSVSYAKSYNCVAYKDGKQVGKLTVNAAKTPVAETKAADRMRKAGTILDYVKCVGK